MVWIMMEWDKPLDACHSGEGHRMGDGAMAPSHVCQVLGGAVLRIMDEEVYPHSQFEPRRPVRLPGKVACPESGLVIRDVGEAHVRFADPVTDGRPRVRHEACQDL